MAYITATLKIKDPISEDGRVHTIWEFAGDAGEPLRRRELFIDAGMDTATIRKWINAEGTRLGSSKSAADALTVNQVVPVTQVVPPTPTAQEIWREKANRMLRMKNLGLTDADAVSDLNTLTADVNTTYQAGYIANM